jgi:hypothetical protein
MLKNKNLDLNNLKYDDEIELICDYCDTCFKRRFGDHRAISKRDIYIKKDTCENCKNKKKIDILKYKQSNGLLKRGDKGYFQLKENVLKELDLFIKEFGHAHIHKHPNGHDIYMGIISKKDRYGLMDAISDLGYDYLSVLNHIPKGYLDNFKVLVMHIQNFIDKNNRFPTKLEMNKTIGISDGIIKKHGGIYEIKRKMNYFDEDDLIDDNNFINKSVYEFIVAQFLIKNEIPYKREQYPFKDLPYKSDFTFYPLNEDDLHVEVWGYRNKGIGEEYNIRKNEKKKLYKENNIRLIEINYTVFENYDHKKIQKYLEKTFSDYFNLKYKDLDYKYFIANKLSNEEIFEEIMSISNGHDLPRIDDIKKYNSSLYIEMLNRFGNYTNFALYFNKEPYEKKNYWNKEKIHEHLLELINNGKQLNQNNIKSIKGLFKAMIRHKGITDTKLEFFNDNISKLVNLHVEDIKWLNKIKNSTPEQQEQAKRILKNIIPKL